MPVKAILFMVKIENANPIDLNQSIVHAMHAAAALCRWPPVRFGPMQWTYMSWPLSFDGCRLVASKCIVQRGKEGRIQKVGPQYFSGLRKGGLAFVGVGLIVWILNWVTCYFRAAMVGLAPG